MTLVLVVFSHDRHYYFFSCSAFICKDNEFFFSETVRYKSKKKKKMVSAKEFDGFKNVLSSLFLVSLFFFESPFTPFVTKAIYQNLKNCFDNPAQSVHFLRIPEVDKSFINLEIEERVANLKAVLNLCRRVRNRCPVGGRVTLPPVCVCI